MKNFCQIHYFHYIGRICPYCEKDKINAYTKKYVTSKSQKIKKKESKQNEQAPSQMQLEALMNRFNKKY